VTESGRAAPARRIRRAVAGLFVLAAIGVAIVVAAFLASVGPPPNVAAAASGTLQPGPPTGAPAPTPRPTPTPSPTPEPTPRLVPAPLTGLPVSPEVAARHPIAVMIDDHRAARPQAGFNAAAIVWQAPAEGGIPRYMFILQDDLPALIGPVRSVRQYYIDWAAEWNAVLVHVGGEPRALANLRSQGDGRLVWNVEERLYEGTYLWRSTDRAAPHNVYSDGDHLRQVAAVVGATDGPVTPAWTFGRGARPAARPIGTTLTIHYPYETITYRYDADSNTYPRFIDGATEPQVDAADGEVVAPSNVVILRVPFGPLNDGHPDKDRLLAEDIGSGEAIISTNGRIIHGTWSKASETVPTLLFDGTGSPVTLAAGQTYVQVIDLVYAFEVSAGISELGIGTGAR
jgi:hypothetical protein